MKYEKNRKILGMDEVKFQKIAKILIIPAVVLVLVVVILIIDKKPGTDKTDSKPAASTKTQDNAVTNADGIVIDSPTDAQGNVTNAQPVDDGVRLNDFEDYGLVQNAVPEVNEVVAKYQRAKTTGNATMLYEVFNRPKDEDFDNIASKLAEEMKVYESYDHTLCYTTAGVEPDSYITYIACDLKFDGIETAAPMLTWAYIYKGDDGNYYMKEPDKLTSEEKELLDKVAASEDVKLLDTDMRQRLAQAVVTDAKLATLYQMWSDSADTNSAPNGQGETAQAQTETADSEIIIGAQ